MLLAGFLTLLEQRLLLRCFFFAWEKFVVYSRSRSPMMRDATEIGGALYPTTTQEVSLSTLVQ